MVEYRIHQNKIKYDFDVIQSLLDKWLCGRFQAIGHSVHSDGRRTLKREARKQLLGSRQTLNERKGRMKK